jgi:hypothetical protein
LLLVGWLDVMLLCSGTPFIFSCDVMEANLVAVARFGVSAICYHGAEIKMKRLVWGCSFWRLSSHRSELDFRGNTIKLRLTKKTVSPSRDLDQSPAIPPGGAIPSGGTIELCIHNDRLHQSRELSLKTGIMSTL